MDIAFSYVYLLHKTPEEIKLHWKRVMSRTIGKEIKCSPCYYPYVNILILNFLTEQMVYFEVSNDEYN